MSIYNLCVILCQNVYIFVSECIYTIANPWDALSNQDEISVPRLYLPIYGCPKMWIRDFVFLCSWLASTSAFAVTCTFVSNIQPWITGRDISPWRLLSNNFLQCLCHRAHVHFHAAVLRLDERDLFGTMGWCWCCWAPTARPLSALIKVKEAGLICMADGAHSTLYHGAAGDRWLRASNVRKREVAGEGGVLEQWAWSNCCPLNIHSVSLQILYVLCLQWKGDKTLGWRWEGGTKGMEGEINKVGQTGWKDARVNVWGWIKKYISWLPA